MNYLKTLFFKIFTKTKKQKVKYLKGLSGTIYNCKHYLKLGDSIYSNHGKFIELIKR